MKVKKTKIKKTKARVIQKAKGKGPNININIDQSKRGGKQEPAQRQPQIITSFTPQYLPPPPPQPYFNFPMPGPYNNPFESAVRNTQARINEPTNNELEKPKPKEKETVDESVSFMPVEQPKPKTAVIETQIDEIPQSFVYPVANYEPVQYIESFPVDEKPPKIKTGVIETQTDEIPQAFVYPIANYESISTQTKNPLTGVKETQTKNPMTAIIETQTENPFTTVIETQTENPLTGVKETQTKNPMTAVIETQTNRSMFDEEPEPLEIPVFQTTSAPRQRVKEGFGVKPMTLDELQQQKEGKLKEKPEKKPFEDVKSEGQALGGFVTLQEQKRQRDEERKRYFEELRNRQAMEKEDIESQKMRIKPVILPPAPKLEIQPPKEEKTIETVLNEQPKGEPAEEIIISPEELEKYKELTKEVKVEEELTKVKPKKKLKSFNLPPASEETQLQNIEEQKQKQINLYKGKTNQELQGLLKQKGFNVTYKNESGQSKRKDKEMMIQDLMTIYNPK